MLSISWYKFSGGKSSNSYPHIKILHLCIYSKKVNMYGMITEALFIISKKEATKYILVMNQLIKILYLCKMLYCTSIKRAIQIYLLTYQLVYDTLQSCFKNNKHINHNPISVTCILLSFIERIFNQNIISPWWEFVWFLLSFLS